MPSKIQVVEYGIGWNIKLGKGAVVMKSNDGSSVRIEVASLADLAGWAAILNESPVFVSPDGFIHTGSEPVA